MNFWSNVANGFILIGGILLAVGILGAILWLCSWAFRSEAHLLVRILFPFIGVVAIIFMISAGVTWMCHNDPRAQCT